ncbi:unnamed protein product, partial [Rotaria sp. Silwood2]
MLTNNEINILDLPDEMLLYILKKLNNIDILYSLVDVNQRFDRLILNSLYTHDLNFTTNSLMNYKSKEYNEVLDRICKIILPKIHHQINKLTLGQFSLEHVLCTFNFPKLNSLSLVSFQFEALLPYIVECSILYYLIRNQIMYLNLDIESNNTNILELELYVFRLMLEWGKHLIDFTFSNRLSVMTSYSFLSRRPCVSSNLTKLTINVNTFDDCLCILDGRFNRLLTLIIDIEKISISTSNIDNMKQISKLKFFSLTSIKQTTFYDEQIVSLLRQMSNLEELTLFLMIKRYDSTYIDGNQLYNQILIHMPRLNKFTFSINTLICNRYVNIILPSNDDIQRSFIERNFQHVDSYADDYLVNCEGRCHIYSLPYQFDKFHHLNNSFQGRIFEKVEWVIMTDTRPFEHEFFKNISKSFPFLRQLSVINDEQQKIKQHSSILVIFPHLRSLNLTFAHIDYVEEFLLKKNTHLPCLLYLKMKYQSLVIITNHFTNNAVEF